MLFSYMLEVASQSAASAAFLDPISISQKCGVTMDDKRKDLEEVIRKETRRGRRPIDFEERRRRGERLKELRKLLELATEEEFVKAMRAVGLRDDSLEFWTLCGFGRITDLSYGSTEGTFLTLTLDRRKSVEVFLDQVRQFLRRLVELLFSIHLNLF